jgi:glycosyltransferase involved in cell wall biosynthesis
VNKQPTVAIIERYVPHYRLPLYRKLVTSSKYNWEFLYGAHPGRGESGLETNGNKILHTQPIRNLNVGKVVWQVGINRWFRERHYKAVIFDLGWQIMSNAILPLIAHQYGIAVIPWSKGIPENGQPRPAWRRLIERAFIHQCESLIVYGQISADYYQNLGYPGERIFVAQNTVDVNNIVKDIPNAQAKAVQLRARLGIGKTLVFGYFGRLVAQKKVKMIIEAFTLAKARGLPGCLLIAGDGPERRKLESIAHQSSASKDIRFCGKIPIDEQNAYFQLLDVFVSAYSAGLGVLEAMAHGKIVLITPETRPETELIYDGISGIVTKDFSVESMAEGLSLAMNTLRNNKNMGKTANKIVLSKATIENMVEKFDSAVDYALKRQGL